jgi:hypothetical protein
VITPEVGIWLARILVDANSSVYTWPELSAAFERAAVDADGRSINSSSSTTAGAASNTSSSKQDWPTVIRGWVSQLSEALEIVIVPIEQEAGGVWAVVCAQDSQQCGLEQVGGESISGGSSKSSSSSSSSSLVCSWQ